MSLSTPTRAQVEALVRQILGARTGTPITAAGQAILHIPADAPKGLSLPPKLVVNISARHIHLNQAAMDVLFGTGSRLTKLRDLYQEGEFASEQVVTVIGPRQRMINSVRILGPLRSYAQVELSQTDGISLGIELPVRISGNHEGTPGCWLLGPAGMLELKQGVIRAARHIHLHPLEAQHYGVADGEKMELVIDSPQPLVLRDVIVRVHPRVKCEVHIDTDEGNACLLERASSVQIRRQV